jgi:hypothetical protein
MDQSQTYQIVAATLAQALIAKLGNITPAQIISEVYTPLLNELLSQAPAKISEKAMKGFNA